MNLQKLTVTLFAISLLSVPTVADEAKSTPDRSRAFELYQQGKMVEAMPILEELAAENPKDIAVIESWGVSVLGYGIDTLKCGIAKKGQD